MNVAVIGAGNIGTRHLQAILKCNENLTIYAVEPVADAIKKSKDTIGEDAEKILYFEEINDLPGSIDIAIVAVSSGVRRQVTQRLLAHSKVRYMILEKVLFPYSKDYPEVERLLQEKGVKTWVNCARRSWPYTNILKKYFEDSSGISMCIKGNMWGLGCNTIHFIDLLAFLSGSTETIKIDISKLDEAVIPSKRKGYVEFTGELNVSLGPHCLKLISAHGDPCGLVIDIETEKIRCHITEQGNKGLNFITDLSSGIQKTEEFEVPFQSTLTTAVVSELLRAGTCPLTEYKDSAKMHLPMIKAYAKKLNGGQEYCNIT